jgi:hypothetical protein
VSDSNVHQLRPADYAGPRYVRPIAPAELARATRDDHLDLYRTIEEQERIARSNADVARYMRVVRWQRRIKVACIVLAWAVIVYFGLQLGRGL